MKTKDELERICKEPSLIEVPPGRDPIGAPPEYQPRAPPLCQTARWLRVVMISSSPAPPGDEHRLSFQNCLSSVTLPWKQPRPFPVPSVIWKATSSVRQRPSRLLWETNDTELVISFAHRQIGHDFSFQIPASNPEHPHSPTQLGGGVSQR
jgi:hypothetical protein